MRQSYQHYSGQIARLASLLIVLGLAGCQHRAQPVYEIDKLPTHVEGASDKQIIALQTRLNKGGARIITIGQDYRVTIPAVLLFGTQSPQLTWDSYGLLNDVVCYLREFRKVSVNVRAFSSKYVSSQREHALTLARAQAVAEYLWAQDVDTRFIFTQGLGSDKPMGAFKQYGDGSPVSRIEITFRRAVA